MVAELPIPTRPRPGARRTLDDPIQLSASWTPSNLSTTLRATWESLLWTIWRRRPECCGCHPCCTPEPEASFSSVRVSPFKNAPMASTNRHCGTRRILWTDLGAEARGDNVAQHTVGESATRSGDLGPTSLPPRVSPHLPVS